MKKKSVFITVILMVVLMVNGFAMEQKKAAVNRRDLHIQANMVFLYYKGRERGQAKKIIFIYDRYMEWNFLQIYVIFR